MTAEETKETPDAEKVKTLKTALDNAAKELEEKADQKKIQKFAADQAAYDKEIKATADNKDAVEAYLVLDYAVYTA